MATRARAGIFGVTPARGLRASTVDSLCLALIVVLPAIAYAPQLGFYSDDWFLLTRAQGAAAEGWLKALELATTDVFAARPGHGLYTALLYSLFGFDPLGHHLFNTAVLAGSFVLLYLLLGRVGVSRFDAFAICAIAAVLPQFSTVRVWFSAFQIPLSLLLSLLSAHCQLSYLQRRHLGWLALAILAALAGIACYEIFMPLLAAFSTALVVLRFTPAGKLEWNREWKSAAPLLAVAAALAVALVVKAAVSHRTGSADDPMRYLAIAYRLVNPEYDWRVDSGLNIYAAISVNFWHPLVGWAKAPFVGAPLAVEALVFAILGAGLVYLRVAKGPEAAPSPTEPRLLILFGAAVFALGLAIFLLVSAIILSPKGMGNRALPGAAIGVAIIFWGVLKLVAARLPARFSGSAITLFLSLIVALGIGRVTQVAGYWGEAARLQEDVTAAARSDLRAVPAGSTVILDGVCPYRGPGVVFETHWDTAFALGRAAGKEIRGDVVSERMKLTPSGLETSIYGVPASYTYGPSLYVYDPYRSSLVRLADEAAARRYFRSTAQRRQCPRSYVGHGELI